MRRISALAFIGMLSGCTALAIPDQPVVHFDGIYQAYNSDEAVDGNIVEYWTYLRFYPDGTVISVVSSGEPYDLRAWFKKSRNAARGTFVLRNKHTSFTIRGDGAKVFYDGRIAGNQLILNTRSYTTGFRDTETFTFVKW